VPSGDGYQYGCAHDVVMRLVEKRWMDEARCESGVPSYAVPGTPFMTALQCITSSSGGPSSRSASLGSFWYVWSSVMRRLMGDALRDEPAMLSDDPIKFESER
jgi:hypothetical protein